MDSRPAHRTTPPPSLPTGSQFPSTSTGRSTHSRFLALIISFISLDQTIVIHFNLCLFLSVVRCTRTTLQSLMPSWGTPIVMSFRKRMRKPEGRVVIDLFGIYLHYIIQSLLCAMLNFVQTWPCTISLKCVYLQCCAGVNSKCFQRVSRKKVEHVLPSPWWIQWTSKLLVLIVSVDINHQVYVCRPADTVAATATILHTPQGLQHTLKFATVQHWIHNQNSY